MAAIARLRIERIFLPFFMLERLAEVVADPSLPPLELKEVLVAGEQLRIGENIRRFFARMPACRLWNQYGPTEAHVVTSHELRGPVATWPDLPCIGRPLPNCILHVLDDQQQPVPAEQAGELYIGGEVLARGYLNAPELTAQRFLVDPFSPDPGARMYRTGDLGRYLADGNLEFLGRVDHQIKIRGHRIEPGEIEVVLVGHPDLSACAVVPRSQDGGGRHLAAFVVGRGQAALSIRSLRKWLKDRLPEPMIPARFFLLDALPLNANGKVDRKALEKLEGVSVAAGTDYVAPRNDVEMRLVEIWQRVFQRQGIGVADDFFDLGGDSLLAARLAAAIESELHGKLPIASLFLFPTIELLERRLTEEHWLPPWKSLVPLQPLGERPPVFFVHGWGGDVYCFLDLAQQLPPEQPSYGLQAVGLDGCSAPHTTVESMAAHYVAEIRAFRPAGPYLLAGYSLGGLIAFEVAQQLQRQGQRVALLALLDSEPIGGIPWTVYGKTLALYLSERCGVHLRRWWNMPAHFRMNYLRERLGALKHLLARNRSKPAVTAPPREDGHPPRVDGFSDYYLAVASGYRLRRYPGALDVFLSDETDPRSVASWRHLARGRIAFHRIPCLHEQMIDADHVPVLAKALTRALDRA